MEKRVADDFDLKKIAESGQIFRSYEDPSGSFIFMSADKRLLIGQDGNDIHMDCTKEEWDGFWAHYFDLSEDYAAIRKTVKQDPFMERAAEAGKGIRILNQDPWEMLISFIISQRKSIPAIRSCIEKICENFGEKMDGFYAFPTPEALVKADTEVLKYCGVGYRLEYIKDAARRVLCGETDIEGLKSLSDEKLKEHLLEIKGVGNKVADCVMLFGFHRTGASPVDVWVKKIIDEDYNGTDPFPKYGKYAGIMQQYAFFYKRLLKE